MTMTWIPVTDRLPPVGEPILLALEDGRVLAGSRTEGPWWRIYGARVKRVSHWLPLPPAPGGPRG